MNKLSARIAADKVLENMISVTDPCVKGAHDAQMIIVNDKAYIVYEANDVKTGEDSSWTFVYCAMSIIDINTLKLVKFIKFAGSGFEYDNITLPESCCFVPRIVKKDENTARVFFACQRHEFFIEKMYYLDFNLETDTFSKNIGTLKLETKLGTFDMQPDHFYNQAKLFGFKGQTTDEGMYLLDVCKKLGDCDKYVILNNFMNKQNALGIFNNEFDKVSIIGNFNKPEKHLLSESAVAMLPTGSLCAIIRSDDANNNYNYLFSESYDGGKTWTDAHEIDRIKNGSCSKPIFEKFGELYYLGWQEQPNRTKFNVDISRDGVNWQRAYIFDGDGKCCMQYPSFSEYNGSIYICATRGEKEEIIFGKLK